MKPRMRSWIIALIAAILFVGGLFWVRANPPAGEPDPLVDARDQLVERLGLEVALEAGPGGGLRVEGVRPDSPVDRAGIQVGDRLMACGDRSVWHVHQLVQFIAEDLGVAPAVSLMMERDGVYWNVLLGGRPRAMREAVGRGFAQRVSAPVA